MLESGAYGTYCSAYTAPVPPEIFFEYLVVGGGAPGNDINYNYISLQLENGKGGDAGQVQIGSDFFVAKDEYVSVTVGAGGYSNGASSLSATLDTIVALGGVYVPNMYNDGGLGAGGTATGALGGIGVSSPLTGEVKTYSIGGNGGLEFNLNGMYQGTGLIYLTYNSTIVTLSERSTIDSNSLRPQFPPPGSTIYIPTLWGGHFATVSSKTNFYEFELTEPLLPKTSLIDSGFISNAGHNFYICTGEYTFGAGGMGAQAGPDSNYGTIYYNGAYNCNNNLISGTGFIPYPNTGHRITTTADGTTYTNQSLDGIYAVMSNNYEESLNDLKSSGNIAQGLVIYQAGAYDFFPPTSTSKIQSKELVPGTQFVSHPNTGSRITCTPASSTIEWIPPTMILDGVYSNTEKIVSFDSIPGSVIRLVTTSPSAGTAGTTDRTFYDTTNFTESLKGGALYTSGVGVDVYDIGNWELPLPFDVEYLGVTYASGSVIGINSSSSITFGSGSLKNFVNKSSPLLPKIFINSNYNNLVDVDNPENSITEMNDSDIRVKYGTLGSSPNRTFVVRFFSASGIITWEVIFHENSPNTIDIQIIENKGWNKRLNVFPSTVTTTSIAPSLLGKTNLYNNIGYDTGNGYYSRLNGSWHNKLPFNVNIFGIEYGGVRVNENSSIEFFNYVDKESNLAEYDEINPISAHMASSHIIYISKGERRCQGIYSEILGEFPNRSYRIFYDGIIDTSGGYDNLELNWEIIFYENSPNIFDIQVGDNKSWQTIAVNPTGVVTSISNNILGEVDWDYPTPNDFSNDTISLPFNVEYLGISYDTIGIDTNGGAILFHPLQTTNHEVLPRIDLKLLSSIGSFGDVTISMGTEGVAPNRTYRFRFYESYADLNNYGDYTGNYVDSAWPQQVEYEIIFYEEFPNQIDVQVGDVIRDLNLIGVRDPSMVGADPSQSWNIFPDKLSSGPTRISTTATYSTAPYVCANINSIDGEYDNTGAKVTSQTQFNSLPNTGTRITSSNKVQAYEFLTYNLSGGAGYVESPIIQLAAPYVQDTVVAIANVAGDIYIDRTESNVTFDDSTYIITRYDHGLKSLDEVSFYNINGVAGIDDQYIVQNVTQDTFQIAQSINPAGSAIPGYIIRFIGNGTASVYGPWDSITNRSNANSLETLIISPDDPTITATIGAPIMTIAISQSDPSYGYPGLGYIDISTSIIYYRAADPSETILGEHLSVTGDQLIYRNGGGANATGLVPGTTYYVNAPNKQSFTLYDTYAHAMAGGATGKISITSVGNNAQYFEIVAGVTATLTSNWPPATTYTDGNSLFIMYANTTGGQVTGLTAIPPNPYIGTRFTTAQTVSYPVTPPTHFYGIYSTIKELIQTVGAPLAGKVTGTESFVPTEFTGHRITTDGDIPKTFINQSYTDVSRSGANYDYGEVAYGRWGEQESQLPYSAILGAYTHNALVTGTDFKFYPYTTTRLVTNSPTTGTTTDISELTLSNIMPVREIDVYYSTLILGSHTYVTGDAVVWTFYENFHSLIPELFDNTIYYVIYVSGSEIKLATTYQNAIDGIEINLTTGLVQAYSCVSNTEYFINQIKTTDFRAIGSVAATAGTFIPGKEYAINILGTTDFTVVGATNVNAGSFVNNTEYTIKTVGTTHGSGVGIVSFVSAGATSIAATSLASTIISAGNFIIGDHYVITVVGTTNFTLIGAANSIVGTAFTATGIGSGTGTAFYAYTNYILLNIGTTNFSACGGTSVSAGSFVIGNEYVIDKLGTTDYTAIGGISAISSGSFVSGREYIITVMGDSSASFTSLGATSVNAGSFGGSTVVAANFVPGTEYVINFVGTTDFTTIGSANNNIGTIFTATSIGSGSGTVISAKEYVIDKLGTTDYTAIGATGVTAGSFVSGSEYIIDKIGTTDYTAIGAGVIAAASVVTTREYLILTIGTSVLSGATSVSDGSFVSGSEYSIFKIGTTDYTAIGATSVTAGSFVSGREYSILSFGGYYTTPANLLLLFPGATSVTAGSFVSTKEYIITTIGTTDYTAIGATSVTAGSFDTREYAILTLGNMTTIGTSFPGAASTAVTSLTAAKEYLILNIGTTNFTVAGATSVTAGSFVSGSEYVVFKVENTDYTAIGSSLVSPGSFVVGKEYSILKIGSSTISGTTAFAATALVSGKEYIVTALGTTTFTSIGATSVNTGSFVVGSEYVITVVGDTSFTSIGASANTVGIKFVATGIGGGTTGVAILARFTATGVGTGTGTTILARFVATGVGTASAVVGSAVLCRFIATGVGTGTGTAILERFTATGVGTGTGTAVLTRFTATGVGTGTGTAVLARFTATGVGTGTGTAILSRFISTGVGTGTGTALFARFTATGVGTGTGATVLTRFIASGIGGAGTGTAMLTRFIATSGSSGTGTLMSSRFISSGAGSGTGNAVFNRFTAAGAGSGTGVALLARFITNGVGSVTTAKAVFNRFTATGVGTGTGNALLNNFFATTVGTGTGTTLLNRFVSNTNVATGTGTAVKVKFTASNDGSALTGTGQAISVLFTATGSGIAKHNLYGNAYPEHVYPVRTISSQGNAVLSNLYRSRITSGPNAPVCESLVIPFEISYLGVNYNTIGINYNGYITFGDRSSSYNISAICPNLPKLIVNNLKLDYNSYYYGDFYYGVEGVAPNRTYRIFYNIIQPDIDPQRIEWDMIFYENAPAQIDIQVGINKTYSEIIQDTQYIRGTGTVTSITNSILGKSKLVDIYAANSVANNKIKLPFKIRYLGKTYTEVSLWREEHALPYSGESGQNPTQINTLGLFFEENYTSFQQYDNGRFPPGIVLYAQKYDTFDVIKNKIYSGAEGVAPNRTFRIRFDGSLTYSIDVREIIWEATFYENAPDQIDIQFDKNETLISSSTSAITYPGTSTSIQSSFVASGTSSTISGTTLTVGGTVTGLFTPGMVLTGTGVTLGTEITAFAGGTGSAGTYTISPSQTVTSTNITGTTSISWGTENLTLAYSDNSHITIADATRHLQLPAPFTVNYCGVDYSDIYIYAGTIWFGGVAQYVGWNTPARPMIGLGTNVYDEEVHYGLEGIYPNRTFRIVINAARGNLPLERFTWEIIFYENSPNTFDIQLGDNFINITEAESSGFLNYRHTFNTSISSNILGAASLTESTTPQYGDNNNGSWVLDLPFNVLRFGSPKRKLCISTNSIINFLEPINAPATLSGVSYDKGSLMVAAEDRYCQRIYYGTEGIYPNRTFRLRWEGFTNATGNLASDLFLLYSMITGAYSLDTVVAGITINTRPNISNRIATTGVLTGTSSEITNSLLGSSGLTLSTTPNVDSVAWGLTIPFNISYLDQTYSTIYINRYGYISFDTLWTVPNEWAGGWHAMYAADWPYMPKILIAPNSATTNPLIYYGVEGTAPDRTYRVRFEGTAEHTTGTTIVYEVVFYENTPAQIDIHMGVNDNWVVEPGGDPLNWEITFYENDPKTYDIQMGDNPEWVVGTVPTVAESTVDMTPISSQAIINTGLTQSSTPTNGNLEDGYWELSIPFPIQYRGITYNSIFVGTRSLISFGGGYYQYEFGGEMIFLYAYDVRLCKFIYYGVEGVAPNRTYRVIYEGIDTENGGDPSSDTQILWETTFYENTPVQIDIQMPQPISPLMWKIDGQALFSWADESAPANPGYQGLVCIRYPIEAQAPKFVSGNPEIIINDTHRTYIWTQVGTWQIGFQNEDFNPPGGKSLPTHNAIFGFGNNSLSGATAHTINLVSTTGNVARGHYITSARTFATQPAGAGYGSDKGVFGGGITTGTITAYNLISNVGVVSADIIIPSVYGADQGYRGGVTPVHNSKDMVLHNAASFGGDKVLFINNLTSYYGQLGIEHMSNTGVMSRVTYAGFNPKPYYADYLYDGYTIHPYSYVSQWETQQFKIDKKIAFKTNGESLRFDGDKVIYVYGNDNIDKTILFSNMGEFASETNTVGTIRYGLAGSEYGGDKAVLYGGRDPEGTMNSINHVSNTGVVSSDITGPSNCGYNFSGAGYGGDKAILCGGIRTDLVSCINLISNTGVVASSTSTAGVPTSNGCAASISTAGFYVEFYGMGTEPGISFTALLTQNAIFAFGLNGSDLNTSNIVNSSGVMAANVTNASATVRSSAGAATYGNDKAIFAYDSNAAHKVYNLVTNVGVIGANVTIPSDTVSSSTEGTGYGGDLAVFVGNFSTTHTKLNHISNTGEMATDIMVANGTTVARGARFGGDQAIFAYGNNLLGQGYVTSGAFQVTNAGVIGSWYSISGTADYDRGASSYGSDKAIYYGGHAGANSQRSNLVSNTGVFASDVVNAGVGKTKPAGCTYNGDKAIFVFGGTGAPGTTLSTFQNLVSNVGIVAADTTRAGGGTSRFNVSGAGFSN